MFHICHSYVKLPEGIISVSLASWFFRDLVTFKAPARVDDYPLVMSNSLLLKMVIEIVDFPS